jgi:hypothetical protein
MRYVQRSSKDAFSFLVLRRSVMSDFTKLYREIALHIEKGVLCEKNGWTKNKYYTPSVEARRWELVCWSHLPSWERDRRMSERNLAH